MAKRKTPERRYKYRAFSNRTLDALIADQMFFADPSTFNDPLDTRPTLDTDIDADALAAILPRLVEQRISAERGREDDPLQRAEDDQSHSVAGRERLGSFGADSGLSGFG